MLGQLSRVYHKTKALQPAKQSWRLFIMAVLCLAALVVVYDAIGILVYPSYAKPSCQADTLLVMGAAQYNGVPSPAFQRRLDKALELYQQGCAKAVLVTGGKRYGDAYTEGAAGVRYLAGKGIALSALQGEEQSTTSFENLLFSRILIPDQAVTIVTDDMHAYRTRYLAKRLGYKVELAPVFAPYDRFPYALNEIVKLMAYHLGIFH